jgi:hypothetical protein
LGSISLRDCRSYVRQPRGPLFADWLNEQSYKVTLLTDETQPLRFADIFKAIDGFVGLGTAEQLVVYFAGHGSVVGFGEYWLFSEAPHNPNEAVFSPETFELSKFCNIPNIIFISDACRSTCVYRKIRSCNIGDEGRQGRGVM